MMLLLLQMYPGVKLLRAKIILECRTAESGVNSHTQNTPAELKNIIIGRIQFFRARSEQTVSTSTGFYLQMTTSRRHF